MSDAPIRITKGRAAALLEVFEWGLESERDSIKEAYGVSFNRDGTLNVTDEDFALLTQDEAAELRSRLAALTDALAAADIFRRRYA